MQKVRAALESLPNVSSVSVDFNQKQATVTMKEGGTITRQDAERVLSAKNYGVTSFSMKQQ